MAKAIRWWAMKDTDGRILRRTISSSQSEAFNRFCHWKGHAVARNLILYDGYKFCRVLITEAP